jgi:hypothetical protein
MPAKKMKDLDPIEVKVSGAKPNGNIAHAKVNNGIMEVVVSVVAGDAAAAQALLEAVDRATQRGGG